MAVLGTPSFRMTLGEINFESKLDVKNRVIKIEVVSLTIMTNFPSNSMILMVNF